MVSPSPFHVFIIDDDEFERTSQHHQTNVLSNLITTGPAALHMFVVDPRGSNFGDPKPLVVGPAPRAAESPN